MHVIIAIAYAFLLWLALLVLALLGNGSVFWVAACAPLIVSGAVCMLLAVDFAIEAAVRAVVFLLAVARGRHG